MAFVSCTDVTSFFEMEEIRSPVILTSMYSYSVFCIFCILCYSSITSTKVVEDFACTTTFHFSFLGTVGFNRNDVLVLREGGTGTWERGE